LTDSLQFNACVCQTVQRWIQVNLEILENVKEVLKRGVKYRVVLEKPEGKLCVPKELKPILTHPNYEVRIARSQLRINAALYDDSQACFSFYPAKPLSESPVILTNQPSLRWGLLTISRTCGVTAKEPI
jgi:hypothetical protein